MNFNNSNALGEPVILVVMERRIMDRQVLTEYILKSKIFDGWHWYRYHFQFLVNGQEHPYVKSIIDACLNIENKIPGYSTRIIDSIASLNGKEKFLPHYDQLKQIMAEVFIINQLVTEFVDATFEDEPSIGDSKKNPEITINTGEYTSGIEVKSPMLREHIEKRYQKEFQLPGRFPNADKLVNQAFGKDNYSYPRDNPVKDFLISANDKFSEFKKNISPFYGILVIVWDDFIYEPITSLLSDFAGLLTDNSFAKTEDGNPIRFSNVDAIILIRHLHQIMNAAGDKPLIDNKKHALDYGKPGEYPFKVIMPVPGGSVLPSKLINAFQAEEIHESLGAEYQVQDWIMWM